MLPIRTWARLADYGVVKAGGSSELKISLLHVAAFEGQVAKVESLLRASADVNAADNDGWTPLHDAAMQGHTEVVKLLLAAGANVNAQDTQDLYTPLHDATRMNHAEVVKVLVAAGADKTIVDRWGCTPLAIAQQYGFAAIVNLLE